MSLEIFIECAREIILTIDIDYLQVTGDLSTYNSYSCSLGRL
jgi:hypothetical protein